MFIKVVDVYSFLAGLVFLLNDLKLKQHFSKYAPLFFVALNDFKHTKIIRSNGFIILTCFLPIIFPMDCIYHHSLNNSVFSTHHELSHGSSYSAYREEMGVALSSHHLSAQRLGSPIHPWLLLDLFLGEKTINKLFLRY